MSFKLSPANTQTLLGLPGSATMTRAGFASKSLWVTEYSPEERWVGGKFPLQNPHPGGILEWVKQVLLAGLKMHTLPINLSFCNFLLASIAATDDIMAFLRCCSRRSQADDKVSLPSVFSIKMYNEVERMLLCMQDRQISSPVMWYVFGTTHIPRPEDFPVMPVETVSKQQSLEINFWISSPKVFCDVS